MRGQVFQPHVVVLVQTGLVVVDEDGCGDVHGVDQQQPFADAALAQAFCHLRRDVHQCASRGYVEP